MEAVTFLERVRYVILQPVDAAGFIYRNRGAVYGQMKYVALALLALDFAFGIILHHYAQGIKSLPPFGGEIYLSLYWMVRAFDIFAWGMAALIFFCRKS